MSSLVSRGFRSALLLALLVAGRAAYAADPTPGVRVHGGVADVTNKVLYLSDPAEGVVAVELDTGKLLWASKEATRPAAVLGTRVYALAPVKDRANAFRVVTLDAAEKGKVVGVSDPATLPAWVDVGDARDRLIGPRTFYTRSELVGGELRVRWSAFNQATADNRPGEARFDLATGKVTAVPGQPIDADERKETDEVLKVVRKRHWGLGTAIEIGGRVLGVTGREKNGAWVLTLEVADLKTGDELWTRVYLEVRPARGP